MPTDDGRVEIIALAGLPEVAPGDDLEVMIGDALETTPGALPLVAGDVLVVTQKVVSKAEGAVVDLRTITPSPEAVEWGRAWDRDPRQVQVVLDEAVRVVRKANGVLIVETHHGFVCANAGVDASNVGPASGDLVTLLPRDPDASAARIRAALAARFGTDVAVIVSDSFGRPWRWGIVDVAIGVSGLLPLEDLRGTPDADGRVMQSTVRGDRRRDRVRGGARPGQVGRPARGPRARRAAAHRRGLLGRHGDPGGERPVPVAGCHRRPRRQPWDFAASERPADRARSEGRTGPTVARGATLFARSEISGRRAFATLPQ